MKAIVRALAAASALCCLSLVQANPAAPMMDSLAKLAPLHAKQFANAKAEEVKALRTDFNTAVQMAKSQARAEFARQSAGKTPEQFDKLMREATAKNGTPAEARQAIDALGGPYKALQQADRLLDDFAAEVLASSSRFARTSTAERVLLAVLGVGDVQAGWFKRGACVAAVYAASLGTSPDSAYKLCDRYS